MKSVSGCQIVYQVRGIIDRDEWVVARVWQKSIEYTRAEHNSNQSRKSVKYCVGIFFTLLDNLSNIIINMNHVSH